MSFNLLQALGVIPPVDQGDGYAAPAAPADPMTAGAPDMFQAPAPDGTNLLQSLNQGAPSNAAPAAPPGLHAPAQSAPDTPQAPRRSFLDTIGRISDVLAKVGGADAMYQPTLDARADRQIALGDHGRSVDLAKLGIQTAQGNVNDANRGRVALAARAYVALRKANPGADLSNTWNLLAQQNGIPADQANALRNQFDNNPGAAEAIASSLDPADKGGAKYGGNVIYAKGPDGQLKAFQAGLGDEAGRSILPDGYTPIDPLKFEDTGSEKVGIGTRSGNVTRILPKTAKPDTIMTTQTQRDIAAANNQSHERIAGMPARGKGGAGGDGKDSAAGTSEALIALDNLQNGFNDLHKMGALPGDDAGVVGGIAGALGRTKLGNSLGEQTGSPAAQKRLELNKTVNTLQQTLIKALPASATRTKYEQEILKASLPDPSKMSYGTAQTVIGQYRDIFKRAQAAAAKTAPTATPAARIVPRSGARGNGPSVTNW
jgi:hypothetical protein